MPCPAMPCHDTHSSTQTGQPLWPGLISCHSRWSRDQGRSVVCSLTAQVPTELPQTLTVQEQCVYVCGAMSACAHACLHVCLCVGVCGHFCVLEFDNETIKKKRQDVMVKGISGCSVHILPHRQAERSSFYCKCG